MTDYDYYVIDKSGKCAKYYRERADDDIWAKIVIGCIVDGRPLGQGDAMIVRDELQEEAGLEWGKDFYLKKRTEGGHR